eukprot:GHVU01233297.1.p2 GENE.GHVU01233297.1~~GHVU01233297.1.p2  ORF type:complete len:130 (+),score=36.34 GHVU01233297.1:415-804(+)
MEVTNGNGEGGGEGAANPFVGNDRELANDSVADTARTDILSSLAIHERGGEEEEEAEGRGEEEDYFAADSFSEEQPRRGYEPLRSDCGDNASASDYYDNNNTADGNLALEWSATWDDPNGFPTVDSDAR